MAWSNSGHPSTNKSTMHFCGKSSRKKKFLKKEPLKMCLTMDGCKSIISAGKQKCDATIIGLGKDLTVKEMRYHHTCRRDYVYHVFFSVRDSGTEFLDTIRLTVGSHPDM